jgi:hypothetical protein
LVLVGIDTGGIGIGIGVNTGGIGISIGGIGSLTRKVKLKISKNRFQIRIPRPRKPLIKLCKKTLFLKNSLSLTKKSNSQISRN